MMTAVVSLAPANANSINHESKKYDLLNPDAKSEGSKFTNDQLYDTPFSLTGKSQEYGTPYMRGSQVAAMREQEERLLAAMKDEFKDVDFTSAFSRRLSNLKIDENPREVSKLGFPKLDRLDSYSFVRPGLITSRKDCLTML
jgi:hypothetical protein